MIHDLKANVRDIRDRDAVENYLVKLVDREAFDRKGLIYGMGHAVYSLSDPRALIFRESVASLAKEKGLQKDFALYSMIEELAPQVIARKRRIYKGVSANVDFTAALSMGCSACRRSFLRRCSLWRVSSAGARTGSKN